MEVTRRKEGQIAASMMCAKPFEIERYVRTFEENNVEYLHLDIMDGSFVPNFTLGTDYVKNLRKVSSIPLDIHLMVERPEEKIEWFDVQPEEYVSIHYESTRHVQRTLAKIREKKAKPMLAINPATPLSVLDYVMEDVAAILIMTVNPGYAGQTLVPQTLRKITELRTHLKEIQREDIEIEVDGNVNFPNAEKMRLAGADIFVAGSSSIFTDKIPVKDAITALRAVIK